MANRYDTIQRLPNDLVIFDLDGCVQDDEWRIRLIKSEGSDRFAAYHANLVHDRPLAAGQFKLKRHIDSDHGIVFITARPNAVREKTFDQIRIHHGTDFDMCLFMRADDEEGIGSVELKGNMLLKVCENMRTQQSIVAAYDDRPDIVKMYLSRGIDGARILDKRGMRKYVEGEKTTLTWAEQALPNALARTAANILEQAGATFRERNAAYKDNADNVGKVMAALFPDGVQIKTAADHKMYHLFELIIVKLTRFANSGLTHDDSIHDAIVYAAMCENLAQTHNIQFK
jgi:hypothetical protein